MARSNHKPGSYSQPDKITLTLSRQDLKDLLEEANWEISYKSFKMRAGIRLDIVIRAEERQN